MAAAKSRRTQSSASISRGDAPRPLSRASTTSIQSFDQRPPALERRPSQLQYDILMGNFDGQRGLEDAEAAIRLAFLQQQPEQGNQINVDPSLQYLNQQAENIVGMHPHGQPFSTPIENYAQFQAIPEAAVPIHPAVQRPVVEPEEPKKKGASSTATNDRELRQLLSENNTRTLKDVAYEVNKTERTPKAERTKQLFAMIWLRTVCKKSNVSVPRSRVYSHYQTRCGTERVSPLNPASFGKLVRVIFPGIQTRRLGVRGESKYHYVDLDIVEDPQLESDRRDRSLEDFNRKHSISQLPLAQNTHTGQDSVIPVDATAFPTHCQPFGSPVPDAPMVNSSYCRLFSNPLTPGMNQTGSNSRMYRQKLKFPDPNEISGDIHSLELPNIHLYTPPKSDIDAANALLACYRTHATSLIDCIRFCKEKQFFRLFTSFHGTLTVPVQKLFFHPDLAPWIKECDWHVYQKMICFVSKLVLQVIPPQVTKFLKAVSEGLHAHITKVFEVNPPHVLEAKLEPATQFAHLLFRMTRANETAHAATALLVSPMNRDQMWQDWVQQVNPKRIMETELPECGYDEVYKILTSDVRKILQPMTTPSAAGYFAFYQEQFGDYAFETTNLPDTAIERIASFIDSLSARFPQANARMILSCIGAITAAACRELTIDQSQSFGSWWVTKTFIDEMGLWRATLGGFLNHQAQPPRPKSQGMSTFDLSLDRSLSNDDSESHVASRYSSIGAGFGGNDSYIAQVQGDGHFNSRPTTSASQMNHAAYHVNSLQHDATGLDHDDSGIGMGLMDDGPGFKMSFNTSHTNPDFGPQAIGAS